jgi:hypothetical protein
MSATSASKLARKLVIAANWKSYGSMSGITSLASNILNKISFDPKKIGI